MTRARPTTSSIPNECVPPWPDERQPSGTGLALSTPRWKTWIVPGGAPDRTASTTTTSARSDQRSIRSPAGRTPAPPHLVAAIGQGRPPGRWRRHLGPRGLGQQREKMSCAVHGQVEEVGGTGDARVVVADRVLAHGWQRGRLQVGTSGTHRRRSSSMPAWFCDVGGTILASVIRPSAPSRSGGRAARAGPRWRRSPRPRAAAPRPRRRSGSPTVDDAGAPPRHGVDQLHARGPGWCGTGCGTSAPSPAAAAASCASRGQLVGVQRVPRERADQVGDGRPDVACSALRVRRRAARDVPVEILGRRRFSPAMVTTAARLDRVARPGRRATYS